MTAETEHPYSTHILKTFVTHVYTDNTLELLVLFDATSPMTTITRTQQHTSTVSLWRWSTELTQQECQHTSTLAQPTAAAAVHLGSDARQQLAT